MCNAILLFNREENQTCVYPIKKLVLDSSMKFFQVIFSNLKQRDDAIQRLLIQSTHYT